VTLRFMAKMPIRWVEAPEKNKGRMKPYLLLALTAAVLIFCTILGWR
jgi:hypothetical protein